MTRLFTVSITLLAVNAAAAQCPSWYPPYPAAPPWYPYTPAVWGAPTPPPLPPLVPVKPPPKMPPALREEDEAPTAPRPAEKPKNGSKGDDTEKETPRIPKTKLPIPGDKLDKGVPDVRKSDAPKKDPPDKAFEQYVIPAEGRGEPQAQVKVGFFNHADREIVLDVNNEPLRLPKGQYVTVRLPRTFAWAEKGAKENSVVVPPDAEGIEIVFRR